MRRTSYSSHLVATLAVAGLLLTVPISSWAETEETINKTFTATPGGTLVVDVDFGSLEITPDPGNEVNIHVVRKVTRGGKDEEEQFLQDRPVTFNQEGNTLTIHSEGPAKDRTSKQGRQRTEGKYTIRVPAKFNTQLKTGGGNINVSELTGETEARSRGGSLTFARLHGALNGQTLGGPVRVTECDGAQNISTSGGPIEVSGGSGSLKGKTSGGPVKVKNFRGPAHVSTQGGGIQIEDVVGDIDGSTSGGSITASFSEPLANGIKLETGGGGVTLRVPEQSAFKLDAKTSGGSVKSELPVATDGKPSRTHLEGPVNGGDKLVVLRTSGGSIDVKKF